MKVTIEWCSFEGRNNDGSGVFSYSDEGGPIRELEEFKMIGWLCIGPSASNEQLAAMIGKLKARMKNPSGESTP